MYPASYHRAACQRKNALRILLSHLLASPSPLFLSPRIPHRTAPSSSTARPHPGSSILFSPPSIPYYISSLQHLHPGGPHSDTVWFDVPLSLLAHLSGPLMNFTKRSQAYPIACGPCLTALGGWTGWHSWLDCWVHKKTGAHLPKCPGVRFAFTSDPPSGRPQAKPAGHATFRSLSRVSDRYRGCFYSWGTHANYMGG